jgi:deoxyribodipyrimidine photo-lyase
MQAEITNPLSDTFRIYNPNKNIEQRDSDLKFIHYWLPELRGYSLLESLSRAYLSQSNYPIPILDWSQTKKINGKIVFDLRKKVKQRLLAEGEEYQQAVVAKQTVDKYWQAEKQQYQEYQSR